MPAAITGFAYEPGTPRSIEDLAEDGLVPPEQAEQLIARGQKLCPVAESVEPLIAASVQRSLASAGLEAADVDRVLIASESILIAESKAAHQAARSRLYMVLAGLGLGHVPVLMLTFAGCGSAVAALEYAALLVDRGEARAVLVVTVDRVLPGGRRVLPPAVSILGDGAASCVVTGRPGGQDDLVLRRVWRRAFLTAVARDRAEDFGPSLVMLGRALVSLAKEVRPTGALDAMAFTCNNYGTPTVRLFSRTLGIADDRVFSANIERLGHLGCADPLVNLATMPRPADGVLVLLTGPADCALALFGPAGR
jgi:3-oxoacyl-[acyl-carrier-protein] synthase III